MTERWRVAKPDDLQWVVWRESCAVHHRPSGRTHFVNTSTARLLTDLLLEPLDAAQVRSGLGLPPAITDQAGSPDEIVSLLLRLEELGLVERVGP